MRIHPLVTAWALALGMWGLASITPVKGAPKPQEMNTGADSYTVYDSPIEFNTIIG